MRKKINGYKKGSNLLGRTTIFIICPFCDRKVEVYKWSFYGSGKICDCGVKLYPWEAHKRD